MKRLKIILTLLLVCLGLTLTISSCDKEKSDPRKGTVTFGANYHVINCMSTVTVFLDGKNIGTLQHSVDAIYHCGEAENITKEIPVGEHSYKVEIRPENGGGGCTKDISGTFVISDENECRTIFIDYLQLFRDEWDQDVIISKTEYENAPNDRLSILDMSISGNCLKIKFRANGCNGESWDVKLIDSGIVAKSNPRQRALRLSLDNREFCDGLPVKEISFNIEDLQVEGNNKVLLNISGNSILYEY